MNTPSWILDVRKRWSALPARDRLGLISILGLISFYLLWTVAWAPAWQTLRSADTQREQLQAQLQRMHSLSERAAQLQAASQPPAVRWREELAQSLDALGEARLEDTGGTLRVQLEGCSPQTLGPWLAALGPRWRVTVTQASLKADSQGLWQGQITLQAP